MLFQKTRSNLAIKYRKRAFLKNCAYLNRSSLKDFFFNTETDASLQVMKKNMLLKWEHENQVFSRYERNQKYPSVKLPTTKYCLISQTKPVSNTRYYAATYEIYISAYTRRDRESHTHTI